MPRIHVGPGIALLVILSSTPASLNAAEEPSKPASEEKASTAKHDVTGTWLWTRELEGQSALSMLKLAQKDGKITGTYKRQEYEFDLRNVKLEGDQLTCEMEADIAGRKVTVRFEGRLKGDAIVGASHVSADEGSLDLEWEAKRGIDPADLPGKWTFRLELNDGRVVEPTLLLTREKEGFKGTYSSAPFGDFEAKEIKIDGATLSFAIEGENDGRKFKVTYRGKPVGDDIKGAIEFDFDGNSGTIDFTGKRTVEKKVEAEKKAETKDDKSSS